MKRGDYCKRVLNLKQLARWSEIWVLCLHRPIQQLRSLHLYTTQWCPFMFMAMIRVSKTMWEQVVVAYFEVAFWNFARGTEHIPETVSSRYETAALDNGQRLSFPEFVHVNSLQKHGSSFKANKPAGITQQIATKSLILSFLNCGLKIIGFRKGKLTSYTLKEQSFQYAEPASMLKIQLIAT